MKNFRNILLFIKVPPPVTGPTTMNKNIRDSKLLQETFKIRSICISYLHQLEEMGKWKISKLLIFIKILCKLSIELTLHRPQLVYFQISPHGFGFVRDFCFVNLIKLFRVRIVFHMHGKGIINKSKYAKPFYRYCFKKQYLICMSTLLTCDIKDVFNGNTFVVPNGVPDANPEKQKITKNEIPHILYLSNLIKSKGIFDYIEALYILNNRGLEFRGIVVGAEMDISSDVLHQTIKKKGLSKKVKYLGPRYDEEKKKILLHTDIFVFPTKNDIWGNVLLEAMQSGLPVISSREGSTPEIIDDGITGFLVEKDAPEQIADKIEILIKDSDLRKKMGEAGRKKYEEKYTLQIFEENMKNVFEEILNDIQK